jgi:ATP-binding cassette subfamily B protein
MDMVAYGGAAVGIILSILELQTGNITLAECFFITIISAEFFLPLRLLGSFFHIAMNGNAAADKIFRLLDTKEPEQGTITDIPSEEIVFDHVDYGYTDEKQVLKKVSFTIQPNSFVALVGESGCGKSTIASLIMGNQKADSGKLTIGGVKVNEIEEAALYKKITRVRHDSYLFKGTVLENVKMGNPDATQDEIYDALRKVDMYDTIMEKGGPLMQIEEKASNLSGGQKQRLVLARAILHDSDIYIFDEATSNIDVESEDKIMQVVQELAKTKLVILISHRLANVVKADQIYVVEKGSIVESGKHAALMEKKGVYHALYSAQQELEKYAKGEVDEH